MSSGSEIQQPPLHSTQPAAEFHQILPPFRLTFLNPCQKTETQITNNIPRVGKIIPNHTKVYLSVSKYTKRRKLQNHTKPGCMHELSVTLRKSKLERDPTAENSVLERRGDLSP
ncbi:hypothetical protein M758_11G111200 [Ceratodon purpureus]|nr:hypothetical protein M758_11G111200 [Ceratodon purpureus]